MDGGNNLFRCSVCHNLRPDCFQLGQPRIFFSMARDGFAAAVGCARPSKIPNASYYHDSDRFVCGCRLQQRQTLMRSFDLCNIGTLFAFVLVAIGIIVLRKN